MVIFGLNLFYIHGIITLTSSGAPVTEGTLTVSYEPLIQNAVPVIVETDLELFEVEEDQFVFEARIPSDDILPGYPVDVSTMLLVPDQPTQYRRQFFLNGELLEIESSSSGMLETVYLTPGDVRASYETVHLIFDDTQPLETDNLWIFH